MGVCQGCTGQSQDQAEVPESASAALSWGKARGEARRGSQRRWPGSAAAQLLGTINQSSFSGGAPSGGALTFHPDL